jgi:hypothetical protein
MEEGGREGGREAGREKERETMRLWCAAVCMCVYAQIHTDRYMDRYTNVRKHPNVLTHTRYTQIRRPRQRLPASALNAANGAAVLFLVDSGARLQSGRLRRGGRVVEGDTLLST